MSKKNGEPCKKCGSQEWEAKTGACMPCQRETDRKYRERNKGRIKQSYNKWWNGNREKVNEKNREEYKENREREIASVTKWQKDNPEKVKENSRRWYESNKEISKEKSKKWHRDNPERSKANNRKWRQDNPEKTRANNHRREAVKRKAGGSYTPAEWRDLLVLYGNKCLSCGRTDIPLTVDHIIPVSKGGSSNIDNLQPLCLSCNCKKHDRIIDYRSLAK